jgi:hypothetical protein
MKVKYFVFILMFTFLWGSVLVSQEKKDTQEVQALKNEAVAMINSMKTRVDRIKTSWERVRSQVLNVQRDLAPSRNTANKLKNLIVTLEGMNEEYEGFFRDSLEYSNIRRNLELREEEIPPHSVGDLEDLGNGLSGGYHDVKPEIEELEERMEAAGLIQERRECEAYSFTTDCSGDLNKCTECCDIKYPDPDQIYQKQWCMAHCLMRHHNCLQMAAIRNILR